MGKILLVVGLVLCIGGARADAMLRINAEVNRQIEYRENPEWSDPRVALTRGWGDCKDFALAKFARALQQGVPERTLKLAYGWTAGRAHVVLLYTADEGEPLVLDNLLGPRVLSARTDFALGFTFDRNGVYARGRTYPVSRYKMWQAWLIKSKAFLPPIGWIPAAGRSGRV